MVESRIKAFNLDGKTSLDIMDCFIGVCYPRSGFFFENIFNCLLCLRITVSWLLFCLSVLRFWCLAGFVH